MADITTDQNYPNVVLVILDNHTPPRPAKVEGVPAWASSDITVLVVTPSSDGMSAVVDSVAPGTARITVTADANLDPGVTTEITGVSEDVNVTLGAAGPASVISLALGASADKP